MGQCSSSSSNGGVAPEPPPPVPMTFTVRISNERKKEKIDRALLKLVIFGEGNRGFTRMPDGLVHITGNFVPGSVEVCLHKYARYVEIQHLDHVQAT